MGIITDGDVGRTSPSDASTLSRYEANYLLSRLKVRDVMTRDVITVRDNSAIEVRHYYGQRYFPCFRYHHGHC